MLVVPVALKVHLSNVLKDPPAVKAHQVKDLPNNVLRAPLEVKVHLAEVPQVVVLLQTTTSSAIHWPEEGVVTELARHKKIEACTKSTL